MSIIDDILGYRSLSIVGMEKNTGKTELFNHLLRNFPDRGPVVAVSSIGIDGERTDAVTGTAKPEITLREGTIFGTSVGHFRARRMVAELLEVSDEHTPLGRIVTARAHSSGKVMLSGPSSTASLRRWMNSAEKYGAGLTIIDGALSRLSSASPAICEAVVLSTGAAFSAEMNALVRETAHKARLMSLPLAEESVRKSLEDKLSGIWVIDNQGELRRLEVNSALAIDSLEADFWGNCRVIYLAGALTERFLGVFMRSAECEQTELIVTDFTKIFISSRLYGEFLRQGGQIKVMNRSRLIGISVNPTSPAGMRLDADKLTDRLLEATGVPIYDIVGGIEKR